ncbi:MAG: hypothetical protein J2P17_07460 [Mycobacterium sp.]|nr:hypothetical protein [Mycobacterium sp.]
MSHGKREYIEVHLRTVLAALVAGRRIEAQSSWGIKKFVDTMVLLGN